MASHRQESRPTLRSLTKHQWMSIAAGFCAIALAFAGGILTVQNHPANSIITLANGGAYSVTEAASRGNARDALSSDTSYVKVVINGQSRLVLGTNFTTVKSVLDAGDITLEPGDSVSPSLTSKVNESTTITITRSASDVETSEKAIAYNTVRKETADLPAGTEEVQTEGQDGVLETTSLVTKNGNKVISSNIFTQYVKKAPVDKVILVGTGSTSTSTSSSSSSSSSSSAASSIGTTVPASDMQQWAHDYLIANGYTEADFTATVFIINHESGWSVTAQNPSGAYGLPQALPGSKMASHGSDWATNYQTQLKWFWDYCNSRYGSIQGAYQHWLANGSY